MTLRLAAVAATPAGPPALNDVFPLMADWPPPEAAPAGSPHSSNDALLLLRVQSSCAGCSNGSQRMSASDRLIGKAHDYEVLAASHSEREALVGGGAHLAAATAFTVAALVMREVAAALEAEAAALAAETAGDA